MKNLLAGSVVWLYCLATVVSLHAQTQVSNCDEIKLVVGYPIDPQGKRI